jgi:hypothetical protein
MMQTSASARGLTAASWARARTVLLQRHRRVRDVVYQRSAGLRRCKGYGAGVDHYRPVLSLWERASIWR